ncbi:MAG: diadenylate cyclase CdaA [Kiritimatiellia bacterium]
MLETWWPNVLDLFQIYLLTVGFYYVLRFLKGTRAAQMLIGVASIFLMFFLVTVIFQLDVVNVVLRWISVFLFLALLVVFHPEIRRALAMLGRQAFIQLLQGRIPETQPEKLVRAARSLAVRRLGALIAVERAVIMDRWCETGIALDALISEELLISIFTPPLPLHDGAVILRNDRIRAAHCIFPIDNELRLEGAGTRHRAAVTLSSECDALILVVSEERGEVSVARDGNLMRNLSDRQLERLLRAAFVPRSEQHKFYHAVFGSRRSLPWFVRIFVSKSPSSRRTKHA